MELEFLIAKAGQVASFAYQKPVEFGMCTIAVSILGLILFDRIRSVFVPYKRYNHQGD